jgi:catechol 2,3-dioxygenase-like lactoylglutathione lyase family enzyme
MITGFDHVIILVDDLDRATEQYRGLGFTVTPGGRHPRFTHNALVSFADGSYLELIAFYDTSEPEDGSGMHRWHRFLASGGGLIDFAVASSDLGADVGSLKERGLEVSGPHDGARSRPDGTQVAWRSAIVAADAGKLPFVIEDVTDRSVRVPGGDAVEHANGVRGIHSLALAVRDVAAARARWQAFLGVDAPEGEGLPNLDDAEGVYFQVGPHRVDLARPTASGPLQDSVDKRGDSVFELTLLGPDTYEIDPAGAGNARLRVVAG